MQYFAKQKTKSSRWNIVDLGIDANEGVLRNIEEKKSDAIFDTFESCLGIHV